MGHKNLAATLLEELSSVKTKPKKPPPPTLPRKSKVKNTEAPTQPFSTPPARKRPLIPPKLKRSRSRSQTVAEVGEVENILV